MYNVLLYNYRVTRVVENFKEEKQMSHNKILRTGFGISTGALLVGMNMMQVPFASENMTETERLADIRYFNCVLLFKPMQEGITCLE